MASAQKKRRSKVVSMEEAAGMIKDGMMLGMGGFQCAEEPNAFSRELIRRGQLLSFVRQIRKIIKSSNS